MAFDIALWKKQAAENLRGWKQRPVPLSMSSAYAAISAGVLLPLLAAYQTGDLRGVFVELGEAAVIEWLPTYH